MSEPKCGCCKNIPIGDPYPEELEDLDPTLYEANRAAHRVAQLALKAWRKERVEVVVFDEALREYERFISGGEG